MNNILIDIRTRRAFLNDWDLCKYKDELAGPPSSQHARSVSLIPLVKLVHQILSTV